jgi:RimJ/RimL family protein N-acetyltransferase
MKLSIPTLSNKLVSISAIQKEDFEELYQSASDPEIWENHPSYDRYKREVFQSFFDGAMDSIGGIVIREQATNKIIGSSRFNQIPDREDIVEIGWSFLAKAYWGGKYNRAFKSLMIDYGLKRYTDILFYVDVDNIVSQNAMNKLSATRYGPEGTEHLPSKKPTHLIYVINKDNWK